MKQAIAVSHRVQLKNIIFATDFSPTATAALPFAAQIARTFGAKLFAVHAKTPENYALPTTEVWPAAHAGLDEIELKRNLSNYFPKVNSEILIREGGVCNVIETLADEKKADLIVVGTSGRGGLGRFILGSSAEEILRRAQCPVLTVGPHSPSKLSREVKFKTIVHATNFGDGSASATAHAVALAEQFRAHLTLLHVIEHPKTGDLVRPYELEAFDIERLRDLVGDAKLWCEPKVIVLHGSPAERILETAEKESADLIVMGVRETKGFIRATHLPAAVLHQVVCHATCPVLAVRA
jgi:nucleotide-binding universal stress UspA family protein